jgi:hypothetical protein
MLVFRTGNRNQYFDVFYEGRTKYLKPVTALQTTVGSILVIGNSPQVGRYHGRPRDPLKFIPKILSKYV